MSLEEIIAENTKAVNRLADIMEKGGGTAAAAPAKAAGAKATPAKAKTKHTSAQVNAAVLDVKERLGPPAAKGIIEKHAGAGEKLAKLLQMPDVWDAVMTDVEATLAEAGSEDGDGEDDI